MQCNIKAVTLLFFSCVITACTHGVESVIPSAPALLSSPAAASDLRLAPGTDIGLWVWHQEEVSNPEARARLLEFCRTYGVTRLFVQVRFEADGDAFRLTAPDDWNKLLAAAHRDGIAIEALDGSSHMGFAAHRAETLRRLAAVLEFQAKQPAEARFSGLHYDIEPYTSARWKAGEQQAVMLEMLETFAAINDAVHVSGLVLPVSHDIPAFYDGQDQYLVEFNGVRKNVHEHIQDLSASVGIMSYRTRATGPNSVTSISSGELAYAARIGKSAYLSLETVPLKETPQITFHGRSPEEYRAAIRELAEQLRGAPGFGGILLHQYRSVRALLESAPKSVSL